MLSDNTRMILSVVIIISVYIIIPSLIIMSISPLKYIYNSTSGIIPLIWIGAILAVLRPSYTYVKNMLLLNNI